MHAPDHGWQPEKDDGESGDEASDTQHMPSPAAKLSKSESSGRTPFEVNQSMPVGIGESGMLRLTGGGLNEPIPLPNFTKELMSLTGQT